VWRRGLVVGRVQSPYPRRHKRATGRRGATSMHRRPM
jgi:hypothetical protein